jgi:DNA-binding transcriptional MerR regulator
MRMSEPSQATGVSVPTLKYYLREGLLHAGESLGATRAAYDDTHVARVRLVRALVTGAGLSVAAAKRVTAALDDPPEGWHDLLGQAQHATLPDGAGGDRCGRDDGDSGSDRGGAPATPRADTLVDVLGWQVHGQSPVRRELETALDTMRGADFELAEERLQDYARTVAGVAALDVESVPTDSPEAALRHVVLGTLLMEPVLAALRRLAQEDLSSRRFD